MVIWTKLKGPAQRDWTPNAAVEAGLKSSRWLIAIDILHTSKKSRLFEIFFIACAIHWWKIKKKKKETESDRENFWQKKEKKSSRWRKKKDDKGGNEVRGGSKAGKLAADPLVPFYDLDVLEIYLFLSGRTQARLIKKLRRLYPAQSISTSTPWGSIDRFQAVWLTIDWMVSNVQCYK